MVEVDVGDDTPFGILLPFAMLTALLIFVHLLSLIIATRILPELEAFINNPKLNVPQPITKGHYWPVQLVWYLSNIVGVLLFLVELVLVAFVKFYPQDIGTEEISSGDESTEMNSQRNRIHVGTATLVVVFTLLAASLPFIIIFFRSLSRQKIIYHEEKLEKARTLLDTINHSGSIADSNA